MERVGGRGQSTEAPRRWRDPSRTLTDGLFLRVNQVPAVYRDEGPGGVGERPSPQSTGDAQPYQPHVGVPRSAPGPPSTRSPHRFPLQAPGTPASQASLEKRCHLTAHTVPSLACPSPERPPDTSLFCPSRCGSRLFFLGNLPPVPQPDQGPLSVFSTWRSPLSRSYQAVSCPLDRDLLEGRDEFCSTTVSATLAQSLVPNGCSRKMN